MAPSTPSSKVIRVALLLALLSLATLPELINAKTKRAAFVRIRNQTSRPLSSESVIVTHKYSDVYKENPYAFTNGGQDLNPGQVSSDYFIVNYNTGFLTTGVDWWLVTWTTSDLRMFASNPQNGRCGLDFTEKIAPELTSATVGVGVFVASCGLPPVAGCAVGVPAAAVASVATLAVTKAIFNEETTCGYKRCFLTEDDAQRVVTIDIQENGIKIRPAVSSNCETGANFIRLPPTQSPPSQASPVATPAPTAPSRQNPPIAPQGARSCTLCEADTYPGGAAKYLEEQQFCRNCTIATNNCYARCTTCGDGSDANQVPADRPLLVPYGQACKIFNCNGQLKCLDGQCSGGNDQCSQATDYYPTNG